MNENQENTKNENSNDPSIKLIVNGMSFPCLKSKIISISQYAQKLYDEEPELENITVSVQNAELNTDLIKKILKCKKFKINKYNLNFLQEFAHVLQMEQLIHNIDDYTYDMSIVHNSPIFNEYIKLENVVFSVTEENIRTLALEISDYLQEANDEKRLLITLKNACLSLPYSIDLYFEFIEQIETFSKLSILSKFADLVLDQVMHSAIPPIYLDNITEYCYLLHRFIDMGVIPESSINIAKVQLPYLFIHLLSDEWTDILQKYAIPKRYFSINYSKLKENNWALHKQLAIKGTNTDALYQVIKNDDIDEFLRMVSNSNINIRTKIIDASLYERWSIFESKELFLIEIAAMFGSISIFKFLMMNNDGKTNKLSQFAVAGGNIEIIHLCEQMNCDFYESLFTAVICHRYAIFKWLVETKHVMTSKDTKSVIEKCCDSGNYRVIKYLLKRGYDPTLVLIEAICLAKYDTANFILEMRRIDIMMESPDSKAIPLHLACRKGATELIEKILNFPGVDVNKKALHDVRPIHSVIRSKKIDAVKMLLKRNDILLDVKTVKPDKNEHKSPLLIACGKANLKIVKILVSFNGCDINYKTSTGLTALHIACDCKNDVNLEIVKLLLLAPFIDINARMRSGKTPLHYAVENGSAEIVKVLLSHPRIKVNRRAIMQDEIDEEDILAHAFQSGNDDIIQFIADKKGMNTNIKGKGTTPLHLACMSNNVKIITLLLSHPDIDRNIENLQGKLPIDLMDSSIKSLLVSQNVLITKTL